MKAKNFESISGVFSSDSEECRDTILDSISEGVFTVDSDWRVTSFNAAAERITGVDREDAIGQRCCDVFRSSICEAGCALRETLASGKPIMGRHVYIITAEGERVPISISTAVLCDESGKVFGGVETFRDLTQEEELRKELHRTYAFQDLIGRSSSMKQLFELIPIIAESRSTVYVHGASGTGKELVARAIHDTSPRRDKAFVAVNCGALPDTLLESELFGYVRGAFTDAKTDRPGRFALADGGTIFLDEIGDISPAMQVRLLRVLQERVIDPLGGTSPIPVDIRVIVASNRDLEQMAQEGLFREDLYYRVNVIRLDLPLLCDRKADIPLLAETFLGRQNRLQEKNISGFSDGALALLLSHSFPGNVRELENIIERAVVLCQGPVIEARHLPPYLLQNESEAVQKEFSAPLSLREFEEIHIRNALQRNGGNRAAAARELGINPSTLFRKLRSGLDG